MSEKPKKASESGNNDIHFSDYVSELIEFNVSNINYELICNRVREISGCFFVVLNKFDKNGKDFTTVGISTINDQIEKLLKILGFKVVGRKWLYDIERERKVKSSKITFYENIRELTDKKLPGEIIDTFAKVVGIDHIAIVNSTKSGVNIGDFTLIFKKNQELLNTDQLIAYSDMVGMLLNRIDIEKELIFAKDLAEQASLAKSDFLSNMSHEIRTPLNGVIGFTDLLRNTKLDQIQKEYLDNTISSANSLLSIISDILDFSKIESGKLELELIKTDFIRLVENACDIIKIQAGQKGLELLLNIHPGIPRYGVADPIRLKQIIVNLLSNAVKFTDTGEVELKLDFEPRDEKTGFFTFSVRDTGIGIKESDKDKLFKAFSQADTSTTRRYGGTGLGLIISNSLAEKMGSSIEFISEYNAGTTFYFTVLTDYEYGSHIEKQKISNIKRVLIVDDNANNRMILEHTLNYWGIETIGTEDGVEAVMMLDEKEQFELIIVDYHMPYIDGLETIKLIRSKENYGIDEIPVMLLHSSLDDAKIYDAAKKLNIRFMLTKPVKSEELFNYLLNVYEERHKREEIKSISKRELPPDNTINHELKILITEDIKMNMLVIKNMLKMIFPKAILFEAENGIEALDFVQSQVPDIILMDVQMPVLDGLEATKRIREQTRGLERRIPIIALTAGISKEERENCFEAGMDEFLAKPIDKKALYEVLIKFTENKSDHLIDTETEKKTDMVHFDRKALFDKIEDEELLLNLLQMAMDEYPKYIMHLTESIQENNIQKIKNTAHSLKGSAFNMEFIHLGELSREIESKCDDIKAMKLLNQKIISEWNVISNLISQ